MTARRAPGRRRVIRTRLVSLTDVCARMMGEVRRTILAEPPPGYIEESADGVLSYVIPLSAYPNPYNAQHLLLAALASRKPFVSLYLMAIYGDRKLEKWFRDADAESRRQLSMGKSCELFKRPQDNPAPLD